MTEPLLAIDDLVTEYPARKRRQKPFRVLHGVSLDVGPGETVGLVGESGSGKTTLGRAVLGLAPVTSGTVRFEGQDISRLSVRERRRVAHRMQVIFQDPYTSLNPALTVGDTLAEPLLAQGRERTAVHRRIAELLDRVQLPHDAAARLPREFSGGQRQRVAVARALALEPRLIVCDEPVSALDLPTQARILDLLLEIQETTGVAYLFVSHDLAVVRHISHRVAVMYHGGLVEIGDAEQVTGEPRDPYTKRLLTASPVPDPAGQRRRREERRLLGG
ncbi:ATP-binding cassette domain-containing protein [Streptomyces sp. NBC_01754]|uniref:ATP-binding cassette domain-containing protein n=1 Tax=Streptomyces sp. NBC_01754 TaxID=2975930 RepID=UPI002DDC6D54|nr:ATP-binding cassette domain-containing protein [Streptomyces sp. NBC_01754]WSC96150.1 ATP-binding cassette domain-containing protein [Streptomyces sp. NBC_01754]